jgi:hypothetical protein
MQTHLSKSAISATWPSEQWQSNDFRQGFADTIKSADMDTIRKIKARLEAAKPVVTRNGQIRRLGRGA